MKQKAYQNHIARLVEFLHGSGESVRRNLEKDMQLAAKNLEFEEAQRIKETLFALEHIQDAHVIHRDSESRGLRIEAYDVAHISGKDRVGVMVVLEDGVPKKSAYKKFKLSKDKNDDLEGLAEIFQRRLAHLEWGVPDVVVLDGDERHIRVAEGIYKKIVLENVNSGEGSFDKTLNFVAVTKDKSHKAKKLIGHANIVNTLSKDIVLINSEAHRFALRYHQELRGKMYKVKNK
jgi:excinuclease ABC subunit C